MAFVAKSQCDRCASSGKSRAKGIAEFSAECHPCHADSKRRLCGCLDSLAPVPCFRNGQRFCLHCQTFRFAPALNQENIAEVRWVYGRLSARSETGRRVRAETVRSARVLSRQRRRGFGDFSAGSRSKGTELSHTLLSWHK